MDRIRKVMFGLLLITFVLGACNPGDGEPAATLVSQDLAPTTEEAIPASEAEALIQRLGNRFPGQQIYRSRTSPVIATHTGPGLIALTVLGDK